MGHAFLDRLAEANCWIKNCIGSRAQNRLEVLEVELRGALRRDRDFGNMGVDDRRAGRQAAQRILAELG
jgi:hypothetical protein